MRKPYAECIADEYEVWAKRYSRGGQMIAITPAKLKRLDRVLKNFNRVWGDENA